MTSQMNRRRFLRSGIGPATAAAAAPAVAQALLVGYDAFTDGLLITRFLFGLSGNALIVGAVGAGASRTSATQLGDYLVNIKPLLDVDGNGQALGIDFHFSAPILQFANCRDGISVNGERSFESSLAAPVVNRAVANDDIVISPHCN